MRRILFGTGSLVLGLAALTWTTAPVSGGKGGRGGGGHASGGGQSAAHVGSVHYGGSPAPAHVAPVHIAPGAVRSEHYAGSPSRGGYRNPYGDEYFRRFRPGYRSFLIGDASYYYYDNLPPNYQTVVIDGITYYLFDGVYYQAYLYGGQTVYMVVPTQ